MTNNDNLESNLPTSSLLKMCCLVQVELCFYCPVAGDVLTVKVLCNLTLQVNLFSRKIIHWLPRFTQKYNGMFTNSHKSRCGRLRVWMPDNSLLGNSVIMNSSWITILDIPSVLELKQKCMNYETMNFYGCTIVSINSNIKALYSEVRWSWKTWNVNSNQCLLQL